MDCDRVHDLSIRLNSLRWKTKVRQNLSTALRTMRAVENQVSVPELHATLLGQLGLDHKRVTYRHHGREESLTDVPVTHAEVVSALVR